MYQQFFDLYMSHIANGAGVQGAVYHALRKIDRDDLDYIPALYSDDFDAMFAAIQRRLSA